MANDIPPVPIQSPIASRTGYINTVWAQWFNKLIGSSARSTSGYLKLPGGIIVQWGITGSLSSGTTNAVEFPFAFPSGCLQVFAGIRNNSASSTSATGHHGTGNYSETGFDLYNRASVAFTFNWIAVGY